MPKSLLNKRHLTKLEEFYLYFLIPYFSFLPLKASQLQTEISHPIEEVSSPEKGLANPSDLRLGP